MKFALSGFSVRVPRTPVRVYFRRQTCGKRIHPEPCRTCKFTDPDAERWHELGRDDLARDLERG